MDGISLAKTLAINRRQEESSMSLSKIGNRRRVGFVRGSLVGSGLVALAIGGCASQGNLSEVNSRLDSIDQRLDQMSSQLEETQASAESAEETAERAMRRAEQAETNVRAAASRADAAAEKAAAAFEKTVRK